MLFRPRLLHAVVGIFSLVSGSALACEPVMTQALHALLTPQVQALGCPISGIDQKNHRITHLCYQSSAGISQLDLTVELECKTSPLALFQARIEEKIALKLRIQDADCQVIVTDVQVSGAIGQLLANATQLSHKVRDQVQQELNKHCQAPVSQR